MPELSLAALRPQDDSYDPFAAEKFVNPAVDAMGRGIAQTVATPGKLMAPNPWLEGSEQWQWYEDSKRNAAARWAPEMALSMIGSPAAVGGMPGTVGSGIKAFHSSPHDFDKFDLAKIGTGEGAQVYGHGLYFAENPAVSGQGGQYWNQFLKRFGDEEYLAANKLKNAGFDREAAAALAQKNVDEAATHLSAGTHPPWLQGGPFDEHTLRSINKNMLYQRQSELDLLRSGKPVGPRTYEVNINADPAHMLDWDKPLREQQQVLDALSGSRRKAVKETLERQDYLAPTREVYGRDIGPVTGQDFYKALSYNLTGKPGAAQSSGALQAGGIPGIKYLDEGSRGAANIPQLEAAISGLQQKLQMMTPSQRSMMADTHSANLARWQAELAHAKANPPTYNYVMFDPNKITIRKKYGIAGAVGAGGMGALTAQDQPQM